MARRLGPAIYLLYHSWKSRNLDQVGKDIFFPVELPEDRVSFFLEVEAGRISQDEKASPDRGSQQALRPGPTSTRSPGCNTTRSCFIALTEPSRLSPRTPSTVTCLSRGRKLPWIRMTSGSHLMICSRVMTVADGSKVARAAGYRRHSSRPPPRRARKRRGCERETTRKPSRLSACPQGPGAKGFGDEPRFCPGNNARAPGPALPGRSALPTSSISSSRPSKLPIEASATTGIPRLLWMESGTCSSVGEVKMMSGSSRTISSLLTLSSGMETTGSRVPPGKRILNRWSSRPMK